MSGRLWQYYKDVPSSSLTNSELVKFKSNLTNNTGNTGSANVEIVVPLEPLSSFWRTFEMPGINCEINLMIKWSANYIIWKADRAATFKITNTNLHVLAVTPSTHDNTKLFE